MPTKSDKNRQNDEKSKLSSRQQKFMPLLLASATYTEACKKGKLSRDTLYEWLRQPEFKQQLERQRDDITQEAFGILSQNLTKAVETLNGLLDDSDKRLKRLTAKDIIDYFIKHKENEDLDKRLTEIEKLLAEKKL